MIHAFFSSTYLDLKEHRAYVIGRLTAAGIFLNSMEKWTVASDEPKELAMARVNSTWFQDRAAKPEKALLVAADELSECCSSLLDESIKSDNLII